MTAPTPAPEYVEQEVNAEAMRLFSESRPGICWTGFGVNRSYWRRKARAALSGRGKS